MAKAHRKVMVVEVVGGPVQVQLKVGFDVGGAAVATAQNCFHPRSDQRFLLAQEYQIPNLSLRQVFLHLRTD